MSDAAHPREACTEPLDAAPAPRGEETSAPSLALPSLKAHILSSQRSHTDLSTPRPRPPKSPHKQRLSTALSLAESLTTPPPAYEAAVRSSSPSPCPSPRRRARAPSPTRSDSSDPTSDSDDPLNDLLRLTSALLSTSTSILASSTALHVSLSRLLHGEALRPPPSGPHPRAELELRSELGAADAVGARIGALEGEAERWMRGQGTSAGTGAGVRALLAGREGARVGRQERAERGRTMYVTATGAGSGFLDIARDPRGEGDGEDGEGDAHEAGSGPALGADTPHAATSPGMRTPRRAPSAAQDLLGRLAGHTRVGAPPNADADAAGAAAQAQTEMLPSHAATPHGLTPPTSRTTLDELEDERAGAAAGAASDLRKSASPATAAGDAPAPDGVPRTPTARRRRATPLQATPTLATPATLSPQPSLSSLLSTSSSLWACDAPCAPLTGLSIPSTPSSVSTTPRMSTSAFPSPSLPSAASARPAQHHRRSSTLSGAALAASLAVQHRGGTTTALASFAELGGEGKEAAAAVPSPGKASGSALSALQALSAGKGACAGGAGSVPSAGEGMAEGKKSGGQVGGGAAGGAAGGTWWSWS
ncbi:hypothetical protein JCM10449v2_001481 [Rhodotorula kratochvilovae]